MSRTLRPLLLAVPFLVLIVSEARPQAATRFFPDYVERALDSALSELIMDRYDLGMPDDATGEDIHRLGAVRRMFGDPLYSFALADSLSRLAFNSLDEPLHFIKGMRHTLDLADGFPEPARVIVKDKQIGLVGRFDINVLEYPAQVALRKFLALAIATEVNVASALADIDREAMARIVSFSDSLILQSEEDAQKGLIEMRYEERKGLERAKRFFNQDVASLHHERLLAPGVVLYAQALDFAMNIRRELPSFDSVKTSVWESPYGLIAVGGPGDDVYTGDFYCIVDVGGNDVYRASPSSKGGESTRNVRLLVDLGGDDTYIGGDYSFGGAFFGASVLIDLNGNDTYRSGNFAQGCGYFGVGILHDHQGSDRYTGSTAVQGAGIFGIGLLIDGDGNDSYNAHFASQGFGSTRGFGAIVEHGGNDSYLSSSPYQDFLRYDDHYESFCQGASLGYRPVASGGYGLILEKSGNDLYFSDIFGQGSAYWYGLGGIVDSTGNDTYTSYQYAQGSGVHLAFGILADYNGKDNYTSHGVSQGCGHDIAFGGLYDARGEDNYVVESLSLGGGNANAISLFIDAGGADGYIARHENTLGYSDLRRNYGMIGVFLDLDDHDFYGTSRGGNDSLWLGSSYGIGLDGNFKPEEAKKEESADADPSPEQIERELAGSIEELFIQGSAAPQKYQYLVEPARKRLEERHAESIPYLMSMLSTEHPREALLLRVVIPRMAEKVVPQLIDTVRTGHRDRVAMAIHLLGRIGDTSAVVPIAEKLITSDNWRLRSTAAEALLSMDASAAKPILERALRDRVNIVRARVARAYARVADASELQRLLPLLNDKSQLVRYQIQLGLKDRGLDDPVAADFVVDVLSDLRRDRPYRVLYDLARHLQVPSARRRLFNAMVSSQDPDVRADGVRLAIAWDDPSYLREALNLRRKEKDSRVLYELYRAQDALSD